MRVPGGHPFIPFWSVAVPALVLTVSIVVTLWLFHFFSKRL